MTHKELHDILHARIASVRQAVRENGVCCDDAKYWLKDYCNMRKLAKRDCTLSDIDNVTRGWFTAYFTFDKSPEECNARCVRDYRSALDNSISHITGLSPIKLYARGQGLWVTID